MKKDDLLARFENNTPNALANIKHGVILHAVHAIASAINKVCPESREKSLALTKIEEAQMWANSAISRMNKRPQAVNAENQTEDKKNG
jgi:hypothetical protein